MKVSLLKISRKKEVVNFVALDFELHQAPVLKSHSVAFAQMAVDDFWQTNNNSGDVAFAIGMILARLLDKLFGTDGLLMNCHRLVLAESGEFRLGFFLDSVFHKLTFLQRYEK